MDFFNEQPDWIKGNRLLLNLLRDIIFVQMKKPFPEQVQSYLAANHRADYLIVAIGDSLTAAHRLQSKQKYVYLLEKLIAYHLPEKSVKVVNAGVPGNTIRAVEERLERDLIELNPDVVVLGLGFNDNRIIAKIGDKYQSVVPIAEYERIYEKVVLKIKNKTKAKIILFSPAPVAPTYDLQTENKFKEGQLKVFRNYVPITRKIAKKTGCQFADVYNSIYEHPLYSQAFLDDGLHPNPLGNLLMVRPILEAWLEMEGIRMKEPFIPLVKHAIGKIPWKMKRGRLFQDMQAP